MPQDNNYLSWGKDDLIKRLKEQDNLLEDMLSDANKEAAVNFSWTGSLGRWYWNIEEDLVYFNPLYLTNLGYSPEEIREKYPMEFFADKTHPDDLVKVTKVLDDIVQGNSNVYEIEYRAKVKDENKFRWYFVKGRAARFTEEGKPLLISGIVFDITSKKTEEEKVKNLIENYREKAMYDPLTKLLNHGSIIDEIKKAVDYLNEVNSPFEKMSLLFLDIDDFKHVNDTYGHLSGDSVLKEFAYILEQSFRKKDIMGRYGGDEFVVLIRHSESDNPYMIAERLRKSVESRIFDGNIKITISGGICTYDSESALEWINRADEFMYEAKKTGKNRIYR